MNGVKKTLLEFVIVGAVGVVLGFCANGLRASGSIVLGKNYFFTGSQPEPVSDPAKASHPKHKFQTITFEEVLEAFNDGGMVDGTCVFVDARNDQLYQDGHIPGALQADHYRLDEYIEAVLDAVDMAEKVVVYCNGGDCEDSIYMCQDLIEFDVSSDRLFLYEGGWNEWELNGQPVATGGEPRATERGLDEDEE